MPLQNRVTPFSKLERAPYRGYFMGNRGILHGETKALLTQKWRHKNWVICTLAHTDKKGREWHRTIMKPHRYTELFFLDEATALAAGHRPCALCRRAAFNHYRQSMTTKFNNAKALDEILHKERTQYILGKISYPPCKISLLPDGAMIILKDIPKNAWLKKGAHLWRWSHGGYDKKIPIPTTKSMVITPSLTLNALRGGYVPEFHPSCL